MNAETLDRLATAVEREAGRALSDAVYIKDAGSEHAKLRIETSLKALVAVGRELRAAWVEVVRLEAREP